MYRFLSICALTLAACTSPGLSEVPLPETSVTVDTPAPDGWKLVWSDEFDGDQIDPSKWGFDVDCWGGGNAERQCYTSRPENAHVKDGVLNIVARRETAAGPALPLHLREAAPEDERDEIKAQPFTSARLTTRGKADWTYGRFEARARAPKGQGTWSAIWMLPTENFYGGWAASGEIDIMEVVNHGTTCDKCSGGIENRALGTIHYGGEWPRNKYKGQDVELTPTDDGFHIYAVEWKEGEIKWFVDGNHFLTLTSKDWASAALFSKKPKSAPFDRPFHLIMNLAIGGHLSEDTNDRGVDLEGYPKALEVDWVRVYQRVDGEAG